MDEFEELMAMLAGISEDALEKCIKEADLDRNVNDAQHIFFLTGILKNIEKLVGDTPGYSGAMAPTTGTWNAQGDYSGNNGIPQNGEYSGARMGQHWVKGHYSRRRGGNGRYSRMSMMEHFDAMEREAKTDEEREKIRKARQMIR